MKSDLAQKYWDLANAIVAFSVLQMLAFLYSLAKPEFRVEVAKVFCPVIAAIAVSSALYIVGVVSCYFAERKLRRGLVGQDVGALLLYTLFARIAIIGVYAVLGIVTLCVTQQRG